MQNEYVLKARFYPAIIALLPLIVVYLFIADNYAKWIAKFLSFGIFWVWVWFVLYDQLVEIIRAISKKFEFLEKEMPTTKYLLDLIKTDKDNILLKTIKDKEGIDLSENGSIDSIVIVVSKIIATLRDNELVFQHNIEYWKARNMIWASLLWLFFTMVLLILIYTFSIFNVNLINSSSISLVYIFLGVLLIVYIISFLYYKNEFKKRWNDYARILFREYLGKNT